MYRKVWKNTSNSVALLSFYTGSNIKIDSITGFKMNEFLITDEYLNRIGNYETVQISFVASDGIEIIATKTVAKEAFKSRIINDYKSKQFGFSVVNIDYDEFKSVPSLEFSDDEVEIGQPIVSLGYELKQENLSIKRGVVSSFYEMDGRRYIQFDASIKPGNAGSPLIDAETGKVIGVIGQKLAEISQSHKRINDIINNNISILKKYQGRLNIDDVDPVQVLIANQNQIKYIARELYNMANMRVGFAIPSTILKNFFKKNIILETFKPSIDALVNM